MTKFGGSSLSNATQFEKVKQIVQADSKRRVVVPSAPGKSKEEKHKVTDLLLMCYQLASHKLNVEEIFGIIEKRFLEIRDDLKLDFEIEKDLVKVKNEIANGADSDFCASRGEYLNGKLLSNYLGFKFIDATDVIFLKNGKPDMEKSLKSIAEKINPEDKVVVPGFYGLNAEGEIETFSRGGSDITGAVMAAGMSAEIYENWTDVSGFLIADPKIVEENSPIDVVTYGELRELSYMGAPVLHEESVFPVKEKKIPIKVLNTNRPQDAGTLIVPDDFSKLKNKVITGISGKKNFTVIRVEKVHMSDDLSFYRKLISVFETNDIQIEHMPTSVDTISVVVQSSKIEGRENKIKEEIFIYCDPDDIVISKGMAIIAVVGRGMIKAKGTGALIFSALAESGINIRMISQGSGEMNIIIGVENEDFEKAIKAVYKKFKGEEK